MLNWLGFLPMQMPATKRSLGVHELFFFIFQHSGVENGRAWLISPHVSIIEPTKCFELFKWHVDIAVNV